MTLGFLPLTRRIRVRGDSVDLGDLRLQVDASLELTEVCAGPGAAGMTIEVRDADTDADITAFAWAFIRDTADARVTVPDWAGREPNVLTAWVRPGRYSVRVTAQGYQDWEQHDVVVTGSGCSRHTVRLVARLQRWRQLSSDAIGNTQRGTSKNNAPTIQQ